LRSVVFLEYRKKEKVLKPAISTLAFVRLANEDQTFLLPSFSAIFCHGADIHELPLSYSSRKSKIYQRSHAILIQKDGTAIPTGGSY
jgi:hypothetical protein